MKLTTLILFLIFGVCFGDQTDQNLAGGTSDVDVNKPEIQQLARESLAQYDLKSNNQNLHKVVDVKSATFQVVAGTMTRITFEAKETSCRRLVDADKLETCPILIGAVTKICKASIWERPWLPNGKEITIDCEIVNNQPQLPAGGLTEIDVNLPEVQKLARESLAQYDVNSNSEKLHKVVNVISATLQVVAGTITRITYEARETVCNKTQANVLGRCRIPSRSVPKICEASIWERPWLDTPKEITVNCKVSKKRRNVW